MNDLRQIHETLLLIEDIVLEDNVLTNNNPINYLLIDEDFEDFVENTNVVIHNDEIEITQDEYSYKFPKSLLKQTREDLIVNLYKGI